MASKWRWCPRCRRWFYPDEDAPRRGVPHCPVCQGESVGPEQAPGPPPANGDDKA